MPRAPLHSLKPLAGDCRGNIVIEFALALPILFILFAGLLDLGNYGLQKTAMLQGAREGVQYGMIAPGDSGNINTTAQNATGLTGVTATNSVFCECAQGAATACNTTCSGGATLKKYITVNVTKSFTSVLQVSTLSFGSLGSWTPPTSVSASVTMIVP